MQEQGHEDPHSTDPAIDLSGLAPGDLVHATADDPMPLTKVDITIAGHTIIVEAHRSMEDVADLAYDLIRRTAAYARRLPTGFDTGHADTQLSDWPPPSEATVRFESRPQA